jgi:hypothetical protein
MAKLASATTALRAQVKDERADRQTEHYRRKSMR